MPAFVGLTVCLAVIGGVLTSSGANVLAWSSKRQREGKEWSTCQAVFFNVACLVLTLAGIATFAISCAAGGAVAVLMPLQVGAGLLTNMFWQRTLRIKHFDKSMRLGTLIVVVAVAELAEIGPTEPEQLDVVTLLAQPQAIAWTIFLCVSCVISAVFSILLLKQPLESFPKLCSIVTVVSITTVIGSSISKCFGLLHGAALYYSFVAYFLCGVVLMSFTLLGNAQCDVSIYIPLQLASQLVINMITGYLVWGDFKYIRQPTAYICVYLICVMAVYLISPELDFLGLLLRLQRIRRTKLSQSIAATPLGHAFQNLADYWRSLRLARTPEEAPSEAELASALQHALELGLETGAISRKEIVTLVVNLCGEKGFAPNASIVHWLEEVEHFKLYHQHDPDFALKLRDTLSEEEQRKFGLMDAARAASSTASSACISLQVSSERLDRPLTLSECA